MTKAERAALREMFGGHCAYCGCVLPEKGWHADHVKAVRREWYKSPVKVTWSVGEHGLIKTEEKQTVGVERPENDTLDNMFPACAPCNLDKHADDLENWRIALRNKINVCRYDSAFRHAERFGLVQITDKPVVFYFETYERESGRALLTGV